MNENKVTTEELHKELDLVQGCVNRMAQNSFAMKGWAITIVVALIALGSVQNFVDGAILLCLCSLALFWHLDAYYLYLENKYRVIYDWVVSERLKGSRDKQYRLDLKYFKNETKGVNVADHLLSKSLLIMYGIPEFVMFVYLANSVTFGG